MTNHETDRRAQWATALWEAAEHHTIAEWICCDPIDPKHGLCVAGGKALEMLRSLIVDDPEACKPAPLTTVALELAAAVSVPPPAPRADALRWAADRLAEEIQRGARFSHEDARQPGLAESVMLLRRWADEATPVAAPRADAEAVARVREKATEWAALAPADDWGDTPQDTTLADAGRYLLRLIDGPCVAGEQQNETPEARRCACPHPADEHSVYGCADGCGCEWMPKRAAKGA